MKGYKVLTADMKSPFDNKTEWTLGKITSIAKDKKLRIIGYGLHLYKSLKNVSIGKFGCRVFEAEIVGEYIEDKNKFCAYEIKLIKELNPEEVTDSKWVYEYCITVKDDPKVRKNITCSEYAYLYCQYIKDDPKVRKYITDSFWAYEYCITVKDDPKVRKYITNGAILSF